MESMVWDGRAAQLADAAAYSRAARHEQQRARSSAAHDAQQSAPATSKN